MNLRRATARGQGSRRQGLLTRLAAMRLPVWFCLAASLGAAPCMAQEEATVAGLSLDIASSPSLLKHEGVLRRAYREVLGAQTGVVAAREVEVAAAVGALSKADYGESDGTLARVAYGAGSLYALYAVVRLSAEGMLVASGRVVRNDGKQMSVGTVRVNWLKGRKPAEVSREVFLQLFGVLGLGRLPAVKEAAPVTLVEAEVPAAALETPVIPTPPELPPLMEAVQAAPSPMRPAGYVAIGVGLAAVVAGVVAFGAEPSFEKDALGNIREADLAAFQSARTLAWVGTGLLISGLAVAATGGVLVLAAPSGAPVASVGVSVTATRSAVGLGLGGHF